MVDLAANMMSFIDLAHDFDTLINLLKVCKKFYSAARLILYRMPVIRTTFNWACFSIHCARHPDLAYQLMVLNLGSNRPKHRLRLPFIDYSSELYEKKLYFSSAIAPFPFSSMLYSTKSMDDYAACIHASEMDEQVKLEIREDIQSLMSIFPLEQFDRLLPFLCNGYLKDDGHSYSCLQSMVPIFMQYEKYFCSVELYYDDSSLDISILRAITSSDHFFVPPLFNQLFEQEIWPRRGDHSVLVKTLNSKQSRTYRILKLICNIVNKFLYGSQFLDHHNDYDRQNDKLEVDDLKASATTNLILYGSSLLELTKSTPYLQILNLSNTFLHNDILYKETGEYESMISHEMPSYYTRIPITPLESLRGVLLNCPRLVHLDLSKCLWVKKETVQVILESNSISLLSVNFTMCINLYPTALSKLFVLRSNEELKMILKEILNESSHFHRVNI